MEKQRPQINPQEVLKRHAANIGTTVDVLLESKARHIVSERISAQAEMKAGGMSFPAIGEATHRSHSTVVNNLRRALADRYPRVKKYPERLNRGIKRSPEEKAQVMDEVNDELLGIFGVGVEAIKEMHNPKSLYVPFVKAVRLLKERRFQLDDICKELNRVDESVILASNRSQEWLDENILGWQTKREIKIKKLIGKLKDLPEQEQRPAAEVLLRMQYRFDEDWSLEKLRFSSRSLIFRIPRDYAISQFKKSGFNEADIARIFRRHPSTISHSLSKDGETLKEEIKTWKELNYRKQRRYQKLKRKAEERNRKAEEQKSKEQMETPKQKWDRIFAQVTFNVVSKYYHVSEEQMISMKRDAMHARETAWHLVTDGTDWSFKKASEWLGRKDHTSSRRAYYLIEDRLKTDVDYRNRYREMSEEIERVTQRIFKYGK